MSIVETAETVGTEARIAEYLSEYTPDVRDRLRDARRLLCSHMAAAAKRRPRRWNCFTPRSPTLCALLVAIAHAPASAVTPLTPRLDPPTLALVERQLEQAHVPTVGRNSVVLAVEAALGFEPRDTTYEYKEPYPQLPTVSVTSRSVTPTCASIAAVIAGAPAAGYSRVAATGSFCLVGPARWSSTDFVAERGAAR